MLQRVGVGVLWRDGIPIASTRHCSTLSDHGESLGERGLYLHGFPYALAPAQQTHVPMLMWFSQSAQKRFGFDAACLRRKQNEALVDQEALIMSTLLRVSSASLPRETPGSAGEVADV